MPFLLCLDFDDTLVSGHFHNSLYNMRVYPGTATHEQIQSLITEIGLKNPETMLKVIQETLRSGNHVAIVSFTLYPEVVKPTLTAMGLTEDEIGQIFIQGGFPSDNNPRSPLGKHEHLQKAMDNFNIVEMNNVILVDDSKSNITKAKQMGYRTVEVPTDEVLCEFRDGEIIPLYISEIRQQIQAMSGTPKPKRRLAQTWGKGGNPDDVFYVSDEPAQPSCSSSHIPPSCLPYEPPGLYFTSPASSPLRRSCGSESGNELTSSQEGYSLKASL